LTSNVVSASVIADSIDRSAVKLFVPSAPKLFLFRILCLPYPGPGESESQRGERTIERNSSLFRMLKESSAPTQTFSSGEPPCRRSPTLDRAALPLPSARSSFEWQSGLPPGPPHFARLPLRVLINGRPRHPVPFNGLNQMVTIFLQCRDLFSSSDLLFSCRPKSSPMNSEAAFATCALSHSLSSRQNGFASRRKSTRQSRTQRKFERLSKELRNLLFAGSYKLAENEIVTNQNSPEQLEKMDSDQNLIKWNMLTLNESLLFL
jgi:hypothetical protein